MRTLLSMERVARIELAYTAWKAVVIAIIPYPQRMVVGGGFEPPKLTRQIYSLIPLAAREPHPNNSSTGTGAGTRSRTPDLLITSQLLYRLSYTG